MPTIDIDGLRINYADAGTGLPIVFVPGLVGSKEWFRYQVSGLSNHHRIICYDLRLARGRVDYSLDLLTSDLTRFLDTLKIHGAIIAGHAFGALIAIHFAAMHPERTLALIAVSASPSFRGIPDEEMLSRFSAGEVEPESFFTRLWKRISSRIQSTEEDSDPLIYLTHHKADIDRATLNAQLNILRDTDLSPVLREIMPPTLIIAGSMEWSRILSGSQLMDECIGDSTLEVIEDAGHFSFFTRHDIFNSILEDFLSHKVRRV